jgi:tight adherence protein C
MSILLVIEVVASLLLYIVSKGGYKEEVSFLDDKKDKLKPLLPMGFKLLEIFRYKYDLRYDKRLKIKIRELNGNRNTHTYLKIHIAQKLVFMLLALLFLTFVGTQIEIDSTYLVSSLLILGVLFYVTDKQLDDKVKERRRNMQLEFPEFLNKLILLINAGLTIPAAINMIIKDNKKDNPLYAELGTAINEINVGKSETQAYEDFAKRCRLQEVTAFSANLLQNLRKGNDEIIPILRLQANTCWENRKNIARKMGEEASTKLLFPMIIIFIAILIMIMTPAVMQIQI